MIVVRIQRSPYQVFVHIALMIAGLAIIVLNGRVASSLSKSLPAGFLEAFAGGVALTSAVVLVCMAARRRWGIKSLYAELVALIPNSLLTLSYGAFAAAQVGWPAVTQIGFLWGISLAAWWRIWRITREVREITDILEKMVRREADRRG